MEITISQAGDSHFTAAENTTLTLAITEDRSQTISFAPIADLNTSMIDQSITLSATASSGLAVSYASSDSAVASVSGNSLTIHNLGTVTITASQAGGTDPSNSNITYLAAEDVSHTFTVAKSAQFITFDNLPDRNITDGITFSLVASTTSGLPIVFESNDTNLLTITGTTATILMRVRLRLPQIRRVVKIMNPQAKAVLLLSSKDQVITFAPLADTDITVSTITLNATASSNLGVVYDVNDTAVATVSGDVLTVVAGGRVAVTARQSGNIAWRAAEPVSRDLFINDQFAPRRPEFHRRSIHCRESACRYSGW